MVARISTLKSIAKVLNYNEQKVQQGMAELVHASSFLKDVADLNFYDKIRHFERLISLNEKVSTNTLHVSLNFDPSELLSDERLIEIAAVYMEGIGFGNQPYLVYRHEDAGHPHIHIVSTNIRQDGSRISIHNLGRNQSEIYRKQIEKDFGLIRAEEKSIAGSANLPPIDAKKVLYGKGATRQAISNVLRSVINVYNYASLEQLNAILKLYNVIADKGEPGSRLSNFKGLQYQVLDEQGNRVGVPINSSRFFMKPTLAYLEKKFTENGDSKNLLKKRLKTVLDWELQKKSANLNTFLRALEKESISVVLRQNKEGLLYGVTYIDHKAKVIFNGSEIGKGYSAKALQEHFDLIPSKPNRNKSDELTTSPIIQRPPKNSENIVAVNNKADFLETLINPEWGTDIVTGQFKRKRKKKKRKPL